MKPYAFVIERNCRNPLASLRVRRAWSAERLAARWRELRPYVTIERDPEEMLRLTADFNQRKRLAEAVDEHPDDC